MFGYLKIELSGIYNIVSMLKFGIVVYILGNRSVWIFCMIWVW